MACMHGLPKMSRIKGPSSPTKEVLGCAMKWNETPKPFQHVMKCIWCVQSMFLAHFHKSKLISPLTWIWCNMDSPNMMHMSTRVPLAPYLAPKCVLIRTQSRLSYSQREANEFLGSIKDSPFCDRIEGAEVPPKLQTHNLTKYDGTGCPKAHILQMKKLLWVMTQNPSVQCILFASTFTGLVARGFESLPARSIDFLMNYVPSS